MLTGGIGDGSYYFSKDWNECLKLERTAGTSVGSVVEMTVNILLMMGIHSRGYSTRIYILEKGQ